MYFNAGKFPLIITQLTSDRITSLLPTCVTLCEHSWIDANYELCIHNDVDMPPHLCNQSAFSLQNVQDTPHAGKPIMTELTDTPLCDGLALVLLCLSDTWLFILCLHYSYYGQGHSMLKNIYMLVNIHEVNNPFYKTV